MPLSTTHFLSFGFLNFYGCCSLSVCLPVSFFVLLSVYYSILELDKAAMQDEVKRISEAYSQEQQKLDLVMKIQQARQRQVDREFHYCLFFIHNHQLLVFHLPFLYYFSLMGYSL